MTKTLTIIIGLALLTGCKEKVDKFIFDSSKPSEVKRFSYNYDNGRLASSNDTTYVIMFGQVVDTIVTLTNYEYDNKGLLKKKSSKTAVEDTPSLHLYNYNSNDSLIREMTISSEGDTTLWKEYNYFPDGRKVIFLRLLVLHFEPDQDFLAQMEKRQYDTTCYRIHYEFENNLCKSSEEYDKKNYLTEIIEYNYENGKVQKATYISRINDIEAIKKIQSFDYSKSEILPDYYSLDLNKDTIEYCKNEFMNHSILTETKGFNYGKLTDRTFFENGKRVGSLCTDEIMKFKTVEINSYYENGDLKEIKYYHEEIKNALQHQL